MKVQTFTKKKKTLSRINLFQEKKLQLDPLKEWKSSHPLIFIVFEQYRVVLLKRSSSFFSSFFFHYYFIMIIAVLPRGTFDTLEKKA